jgi:predicted RNase H-like HicB family nuclease
MAKQFDVVIERDSDGFYVVSVLSLAGCHTQALSLDQLMGRIREAIGLCLEFQDAMAKQLDFVSVRRVTV